MAEMDASHGDILRAIGNLEGKIEQVLKLEERLTKTEIRVGQATAIAVALSVALPLLVTMAAPRIEFGPNTPPPSNEQPAGADR